MIDVSDLMEAASTVVEFGPDGEMKTVKKDGQMVN